MLLKMAKYHSFFKILFIYGRAGSPMLCAMGASCGDSGLLFNTAHKLLVAVASLAAEHRLQVCGDFSGCSTWAQLCHGMRDLSSLIWGRTHIPCIGRQTLKHWAMGEVLFHLFLWLSSTPLYVCSTSSSCRHQTTFRLSPRLGHCNNAAMNTEAHASLISVFIFSRYMPRSGKVALYRLSPMNPAAVVYQLGFFRSKQQKVILMN